MALSRREFLAVSAAAGAACCVPTCRSRGAVRADEKFFDWKDVAKDALAAFGFGGNSLAVLGTKGVLVVDCKNAPFGPQLRREAEALGKLAMVVNTHHHADHTGG